MILAFLAVLAGGLLIVAVLTSGSWLFGLLGWLDRVLTRMKFGTWSARFLTWAEDYVSAKMPQRRKREWGRGKRERPSGSNP
jgi:hypothetical protein